MDPSEVLDAVFVIKQELSQQLVDDQPVVVENFGTINPYIFHGHRFLNLHTRKIEFLPAKRNIKLHPHYNFRLMVLQRAEDLRDGEENP